MNGSKYTWHNDDLFLNQINDKWQFYPYLDDNLEVYIFYTKISFTLWYLFDFCAFQKQIIYFNQTRLDVLHRPGGYWIEPWFIFLKVLLILRQLLLMVLYSIVPSRPKFPLTVLTWNEKINLQKRPISYKSINIIPAKWNHL